MTIVGRRRHRPLWRKLAGCLLAAVLVVLVLFGALLTFREAFVDIGRTNVCAPGTSRHCFTNEPGIVESVDGRDMRVHSVLRPSESVLLVAYDSWDHPPEPGAPVVLQRWEGDDIVYVYDARRGRQQQTNDAPDRGNAFVFGVLLLGLAAFIVSRAVLWLLD